MSKTDALDLMITSNLDLSTLPNTEMVTWTLNRMDQIIQESVDKKDVTVALNVFCQMRSMAQISGLALARGIYKLYKNWKSFDIKEDFADYIYTRINMHHFTIERYIKVAAMWEKQVIPDEYHSAIQSRNIKDQVPLAMAISQGYVFDDDEWKELAHAPDSATFTDLIRKFKKEEGRSSRMLLMLDRDGNMYVQQKNYDKKFIGTLEIDSDDMVVRQAVERVIRCSGMLRR